MTGRRVKWVGVAAAFTMGSIAPRARAADPTSLACIHAAEEGQNARDTGKLLHARDLFATCGARDCPALLRRDCTTWLEESKQATPSVVIVARDVSGRDIVDAKAIIDGTVRQERLDGSVIELDPGSHIVRVEMAAHPPVEVRVVFGAGEKNRTIVLTMANEPPKPAPPPPPPPKEEPARGLPAATYVFGAIGIAALGSFGYFGARGTLDADHLKKTCAPGCDTSDVDSVHTKLLIADVSLGVSVVSFAAAIFFALQRRSPAPASTALTPRWEVHAAPHASGATGEIVLTF